MAFFQDEQGRFHASRFCGVGYIAILVLLSGGHVCVYVEFTGPLLAERIFGMHRMVNSYRLIEQLRRATLRDSSYSKAARTQLIKFGASMFCAQPEDVPPIGAV